MTNTYEVRILNQKFQLKTDNDESHVKIISDYVNKVFHEIEQKNHNISSQNVAILGALNIAEELFAKQELNQKKITEWKNRLNDLASPQKHD